MVTGTPNSRRVPVVRQAQVLDRGLTRVCELDTFPVGRVQHERRRGIAGGLELGDALPQRGHHARRVRLRLDPAGGVNVGQHLRLDSGLQTVLELVAQEASNDALSIS